MLFYIVSTLEYEEPAVRILDVEDATVKDMTEADLVKFIKNGSMELENAVVQNGVLKMVNGPKARYGKIQLAEFENDPDIVIEDALVILEELYDKDTNLVGYNVANAIGDSCYYSLADMEDIVKTYNIANAEVAREKGKLIIAPTDRPFPTVEIEEEALDKPYADAEAVAEEAPVEEVVEETPVSKDVKITFQKNGVQRSTTVTVDMLARAFMALDIKNVEIKQENGVYQVTRGMPDEVIEVINDKLIEIELPPNVEVGQNVFANMRALKRVVCHSKNIGGGAFMLCENLEEIELRGTETIADLAFYGCSGLKRVVFPNTLTVIGYNAFFGCGLEEISVPDSVKTIYSLAFGNCKSLTTATIPVGVMKDWAKMLEPFKKAVKEKTLTMETAKCMAIFHNCESLETINMSAEDVIRFGDFEFKGCKKLFSKAVE